MARMTVAALLLCLGGFAQAQVPAPAAAPNAAAAAAQRDLWLADEGRYVRRWLLLGPLSPAQADELAKTGAPTALGEVAPGSGQRFAGNGAAVWRAQTTYGDILDGFSAAGMKNGDIGFALAMIERPAAGEASLLLGGNVRGVWVNGVWVDARGAGGGENSPAFVIDGTALRVPMNAGQNRILLRVERLDRPVLLTLRAVSPGFVGQVAGGISPYIGSDAGDLLRVFSGARSTRNALKIRYEVIAPGGRVVAEATTSRDQPREFETTQWPDGPYEVHVTGPNSLGDPVYVHLPWYKGDAQAAARRVLDAAAVAGADDHVKMLADMLRDRAGGDWRALHSPLMEYQELLLERAGQTGGARSSGFVRLAWTDDIDGSTQFCRAYLPAVYGSTAGAPRASPALIFLHGYNPPNPPYVRWWSIADRHNGVAERHALIVLEPMGRGNVDYRWMGERDVLRCLDEARKRLQVDDERVYLTGESMGGNGSWLISSRHPQRFAAAAPIYGGSDYRTAVTGYNYTNPLATRPMERFVQEAHSSFAGAEGLRNVPLYVLHGDVDAAVPVEQSRHGVKLLQRWGYEVRYREVPGLGHEDLKARDEIADWLLTHRRDPAPREVRLRSYDLAGANAHWLRVTTWETPFEMIEARVQALGDGSYRLDTKNVAAVEMTPPAELGAGDGVLTVTWNGRQKLAARTTSGSYVLNVDSYAARAGDKNPAREGRLTYFFNTPFAIVVGTTSKDPAMVGGLAAKAEALSDLWERWQHVKPRVFRDVDLSPLDMPRYSLLLLGGPDANAVSADLARGIPLKVTRDSVTLDGRRFTVNDAVVQMLYPHPRNLQRYVLAVQPTSTAGLRFWNPQQYWHALNGFPLNLWDWTIVDGRHAIQESGQFPDRGWVAAGIFDAHWKRNDDFTVLGDAELRARATLRHPPPAGFKLPAAALDALAGRYRINPGQIGAGGLINVTRSGDTLTASAPEGGRAWPLEPETDSDFAIVGLGTPVSFLRDGAGNATGVVYHYNGQEIVATKLP
jgi:dienelactone hydrolase